MRLFGDRCGDARIGVAVEIHPPGRDGVDDFAAVGDMEKDALGVGKRDRRRIKQFVGEGMPDAKPRTHCEKAERSKWFKKTCIRAVRWRLGSLGISPITRTWPNFSMVSRFSRF